MANQQVSQPARAGTPFFYGYIVVLAVFILQVAMYGPLSSYGVFFKPILTDLQWSRALVSGASSLASVMQGIAAIAMGSLNDRLGPRAVLSLCGLLVGAGYLLMSQVNAAWQLYLFYVVIVGTGMGGAISPQLSTVARWFVKRRGLMTGLVIAGGGAGGLLVPPTINWLISSFGWRNAFLFVGAATLIIIILAAQLMRRDPKQMGLTAYGAGKGQAAGTSPVAEGLTLREAAATRQLWTMAASYFSVGFGYMIILVHIIPYATDIGISQAAASGMLSVIGAAMLASAVVLGFITDKIGRRRTFTICLGLLIVATFCLLIADGMLMLYVSAIFAGLVGSGLPISGSPLLAELFGAKSHGLFLGVCSFSLSIGAAAGPFLAGYIFDIRGNYQLAFSISTAVAVAGLILALTLRPIKGREQTIR